MRIFFHIILSLFFIGGYVPVTQAGVFGATELRRTSLSAFSKWGDMLTRHQREDTSSSATLSASSAPLARSTFLLSSGACRPDSPIGCARPTWPALLAPFRSLERKEQIRSVNATLNRQRYVTDMENWGIPDYWETVRQFLARDGDCEDFAIAKYVALKSLGFPPSSMRIIIVQDLNLGVPHAVLSLDFNGQTLILDNQIQEVLPDTAIVHYRPIYAINETAWWLYQPRS